MRAARAEVKEHQHRLAGVIFELNLLRGPIHQSPFFDGEIEHPREHSQIFVTGRGRPRVFSRRRDLTRLSVLVRLPPSEFLGDQGVASLGDAISGHLGERQPCKAILPPFQMPLARALRGLGPIRRHCLSVALGYVGKCRAPRAHVREVAAFIYRRLNARCPLLRFDSIRECRALSGPPFYSHLRTVRNFFSEGTDDSLNAGDSDPPSTRVAESNSVHEFYIAESRKKG